APPGVEQMASWREFERHLYRAMDELPEKLRIVVVLAGVEGYDTREVAALLGLPEGTVKSRLYAARKQLAERLRWIASDTRVRCANGLAGTPAGESPRVEPAGDSAEGRGSESATACSCQSSLGASSSTASRDAYGRRL